MQQSQAQRSKFRMQALRTLHESVEASPASLLNVASSGKPCQSEQEKEMLPHLKLEAHVADIPGLRDFLGIKRGLQCRLRVTFLRRESTNVHHMQCVFREIW